MIGGIGIQSAGLELLGGVHDELNAADLGEAAHGLGGGEGGGFQGLQQLRAGDLDDAQGVAKGQDRVHVFFRDVSGGNGGPDAAAVGDGRVHFLAVFSRAPDQGVGDQVAQVGFLGAVAGVLVAVEQNFGFGKGRAVVVVNLLLDGGGPGGDLLHAVQGNRLHRDVPGGAAVLRQHHGAHIGQLGAGGGHQGVAPVVEDVGGLTGDGGALLRQGLQGLAGGLGHLVDGGVGVAVDQHVDALHGLQEVDGAVALGLVVNAQVGQADDVITALVLQRLDLGLGDGEHVLARGEGHALDLGGMGLGAALGGGQAEHADLFTAGSGENGVGIFRLAVYQHVGGDHGEFGVLGDFLEVGIAVVELMVSDGGGVIARQVHQLHGGLALADADGGVALDVVARVQQQGVGARVLEGLLQRGHLGVAADGSVDIVGMENDDLALQGLALLLRGAGGDAQREHHRQNQQQGQEFLGLHSFTSSLFSGTGPVLAVIIAHFFQIESAKSL